MEINWKKQLTITPEFKDLSAGDIFKDIENQFGICIKVQGETAYNLHTGEERLLAPNDLCHKLVYLFQVEEPTK